MGLVVRQGDYCHPKSGRTYRQGDPAHSYVLALVAARRAAEAFLRETARLIEADYLTAFEHREDRTAAHLRDMLDWLSHAEHGVRLDRHRREPPDDEWNRKYGPVTPPS